MQNVSYERKGDKLILTVDIGKDARQNAQPSASGKTLVVASTHGNQNIEGVTLGLNVYIRPAKAA